MKTFLNYLKQEKRILFFALLAAAINQIFSLFNPQIFGRIIDNYGAKISELSRPEFIKGVVIMLLLYMGVALISRTAKAFQDYFVNTVSEKIGTNIYANHVKHVFTLPFSVFENEQSGSILQKMQKARDSVKSLIQNTINIGFFSLIGMLFVVIYAFSIHPWIGIVFLSSIPVVGGVIASIGKRVKKAQQKIVARSAELAASTTETLQNVGLVKSLGLEDQEIKRLNMVNKLILGLELKKVIVLRKMSFIQGTLINTISSLILLVGMLLVFKLDITLGQFLALWFYGFYVFGPLSQISILVTSYQETKAALLELDKVTREEVYPVIAKRGEKLKHIENITLKDISFNYQGNTGNILKNISLHIKNGSTIGLVGPSGSGKSTLLKLILGLYNEVSGALMYNGKPRSSFHPDSIKHRIGYVPQDSQVFAGSIKENLLFVSPEASDNDCIDSLQKARIWDKLKEEKGLETIVGENGIKLSGGERQRIAIARAILRKPDMLIFDEATSSLDTETERAITETIKEIKQEYPDLIMIIVAHRLSTIEHCDQIHVLTQGELIESGTHQELLDNKNIYYGLHNLQK